MLIEKLVVGDMEANCYIVADKETAEAVIIDPGGSSDKIISSIKENDLTIKYVVNTHGHIDHMKANEEIINVTAAQLLIHKEDAAFLKAGNLNLSNFVGGKEVVSPAADRMLEDGSVIKFGNIELKVLHTPGHTAGSICLLGSDVLFSGDTLFFGGVGRTDFPTGSRQDLDKSLRELTKLDHKLKVYPGHGPIGVLTEIKKNNPYI
ncbi:MAG: MBL fold metallo-hydrolase [Bacillota bacterium]